MPTIDLPLTPAGPLISVAIFVSVQRHTVLQANKAPIPKPVIGIGLIDTGASGTAVDNTVVQALGLVPTGSVQIHTPSTGSKPHACNSYDVSLWFMSQPPTSTQPSAQPASQSQPFHPIHITLPVFEANLSPQKLHALIGRDVLGRCQFDYDGKNGRFRLTY
jgi:hypothetical protein